MMLDFYRLLTAAQGSMGIASWASLKCELLPRIHRMYFAVANKLESLIDFVYRVIRLRFSDELLIVNSSYLASLIGESLTKLRSCGTTSRAGRSSSASRAGNSSPRKR
jgi:hypothetical protein